MDTKDSCKVYKIKNLHSGYINITNNVLIFLFSIIPILFIIFSPIIIQLKIFLSSFIVMTFYVLFKQEYKGNVLYLYIYFFILFMKKKKKYYFEEESIDV